MSAEFDFKAAYHKEHADLCHLEARNYVLRAALRKIIDLPKTTHAIPNLDDHFIAGLMEAASIASKALGEEKQ